MKKIFTIILAIFLTTTSFAQNWDNVIIVGGVIGSVVSSEYALYQSLIKRELKGWSTPETGTSVKLENQCGIDTEFHLIGDYKRNYIMVGVSNTSGKPIALNLRRVKFIVNKNTERFPGYSYQVSDENVNSGWWVLANIPLPQKSELATYDHIKVDIPVIRSGEEKACHIVTEFQRSGHYPKEDVSYNFFDFMFDFGPSIAQTGGVKKLGTPDYMLGMNFNWYFAPNHGAGMNFMWESDYDGPKGSVSNGSIFSGDFHYVYRKFLNPKLSLNFEPGIGFQTLYDDYHCRNCHQSVDSTFMMDYRLMLQYVLKEWNIAEINVMNFFMGGGLVQQYGFSGDTNGSRFGLLFRVGFGY